MAWGPFYLRQFLFAFAFNNRLFAALCCMHNVIQKKVVQQITCKNTHLEISILSGYNVNQHISLEAILNNLNMVSR